MKLVPGVLCGLSLITSAGCGSNLPETAPVRGVVEIDGKALTQFDHAAVVFTPKGGRPAKSVISPQDGSFELGTYKSSDGARLGPHSVSVSATVDDKTAVLEKGGQGVKYVIPTKFADHELSGLTYDVKPGSNIVHIQLHSNGTGTVVPQ